VGREERGWEGVVVKVGGAAAVGGWRVTYLIRGLRNLKYTKKHT
jgi:hypothetical protein